MRRLTSSMWLIVVACTCVSTVKRPDVLIEIRQAKRQFVAGEFEMQVNRGFFVEKAAIVTDVDFASCEFTEDQGGERQLGIELRRGALDRFNQRLAGWKGYFVVMINGRVIASFLADGPLGVPYFTVPLPDPLGEGEREAIESVGKD